MKQWPMMGLAGCCMVLSFVMAVPALGQDSIPAEVLSRLENGAFVVVIESDTMMAITQEMAANSLKLQVDLDALRRELDATQLLIASYETTIARYDSTRSLQARYIAELDSLYRGYREVAEGYKRLSGEPWVTFQAGLGATGPDENPAVMAGIGIRRVRIWGFFQEGNAGALLGVNLRVF